MNKIVTICVFILIAIHAHEIYQSYSPVRDEPEGYSHITAEVIDEVDNVCKVMLGEAIYKIDVRYFTNTEENNTLAGRWDEASQRILLSNTTGLDIDTVTHEVSHAVDSIMIEYNIKDHHYEAYLQGRISRCIWQIVEQDTQHEEDEAFKFAN